MFMPLICLIALCIQNAFSELPERPGLAICYLKFLYGFRTVHNAGTRTKKLFEVMNAATDEELKNLAFE